MTFGKFEKMTHRSQFEYFHLDIYVFPLLLMLLQLLLSRFHVHFILMCFVLFRIFVLCSCVFFPHLISLIIIMHFQRSNTPFVVSVCVFVCAQYSTDFCFHLRMQLICLARIYLAKQFACFNFSFFFCSFLNHSLAHLNTNWIVFFSRSFSL